MRKIVEEEYRMSNWSGGTTTQLLIWPPQSDYSKRDFLFRISSATVELEESTFTELPGIHRFLTVLDGSLELLVRHDDEEEVIKISSNDIYEFEGEWEVKSKGCVRDFNLMLNNATGKMEYLTVSKEKTIKATNGFLFFYMLEGSLKIINEEKETLVIEISEGESFFEELNMDTEFYLTTEQDAKMIVIGVKE